MSVPGANRTTEYQYTLDGQLAVLIARNDVTGDQVTRWIYGTTLEESGVASNALVRAKIFPDSDDNAPGFNGPDMVYDRVEYRYNRQGELIEQRDQNETVHAFDFDRQGRLLHDRVTALGAGIDGAVRRISRSYDRAGRVESVTSWSEPDLGAGRALNQVLRRYNAFGQLTAEYQSHDGLVAAGSTPVVRYTYADGSERHIRRLSTIYPNARELLLYYGAPGSADDRLGRVQEIRDGGGAETALARYTRRGLSATMQIEYVQCGPATPVTMSYIKQGDEPDGPAGDQYTGQDQFNRIIDVRWLRHGTSPVESIDRFEYGFDRASYRTFRRNILGSSYGYDEKYRSDGLYQLAEFQRGTLDSSGTISGTPKWQENFLYDPTGNWRKYRTQVASDFPINQTRTHNEANEIIGITTVPLPAMISPVGYDATGNMTSMPKSGDWNTGQKAKWDAWNRLVQVSEGNAIIGEYQYDALTRRTWKRSDETGDGPVYRHFYYSDKWQILEQRTGTSSVMDRQFVWGLRYIDDLVLRDRSVEGPEVQRLYATHDQWHCTAVVGRTGTIEERFAYDAFGHSAVLSDTFEIELTSAYDWESRYGSYHYDSETALYCARYRYLHPGMGRWLSTDPLLYWGGDFNLFRYASNRPADRVDPFGLYDWEVKIIEKYDQPVRGGRTNYQIAPEATCSCPKVGEWKLTAKVMGTITIMYSSEWWANQYWNDGHFGAGWWGVYNHEWYHVASIMSYAGQLAEKYLVPAEGRTYASLEECGLAAFEALKKFQEDWAKFLIDEYWHNTPFWWDFRKK